VAWRARRRHHASVVTANVRCWSWLCCAALVGCRTSLPSESDRTPEPPATPAIARTTRFHGHNDYLQPVPLQRALTLGLGSVEADVFLVDGELRVGHERWQLRPGRTLARLYLEPLRAWAEGHGGRVRADGKPFVLLIDIKADAAVVYEHLRRELLPFVPLLTHWRDGNATPGAITVILSGARPHAQVAAERERCVALDGRLADLDRVPPPSPALMPWLSAPWSQVSDWNGRDEFTAVERQALAALVARVHAAGHELRFWGAPDEPAAWQLFVELGIDRIGTDRPAAAVGWLAGPH
jgi:hypothetical protein